jgi:homopolymeric O-antigen transport system ATP-binding protein
MSAAITIDGVSKCYQLGLRTEKYLTLRDTIMSVIKSPLQRLAGLRGKGPDEGKFWALKDVSFDVARGEVIGIIGRNGAGKSTLLKILSRITEPTEGRARLKGRVASLLEVGTGFHPELTGRENVYLNGAILGMRKAEIDRKFDEIVAFAETEQFLDTPVKRYSSGMYVRLAFAVAAHLEPEILLVDEVLAVGDHEFQKKCLGRIQQVAQGDGRTVLFVSHNMGSVQNLCDRAVYLRNGSVVQIGNASTVVEAYLNSSITEEEKDLLQRPRFPGLVATLAGFSMVPPPGQERVISGGEAIFEFQLDVKEPVKNACLGFMFNSDKGYRVLGLNSRLELRGVTLNPGKRVVRCTVDSLPLKPGRYIMDIEIRSNAKPYDYVEHATALDVEFDDFYGTGEMLWNYEGSILHRATWEV